jgi:hypothetical protein
MFFTVTTALLVTVNNSMSALSPHLTALFTVTNFGAALEVVGNNNPRISAGISKNLSKFL